MNIWLLSFESTYTVKVGGLAEVPPRLGEALKKHGHNAYVLTPNHGFTEKLGRDHLEELLSININNVNHKVYLYDKPPTPHIIFTGGILDHPEVYSPTHMMDKIRTWSILVRILLEKINETGIEWPDVIHGNDWHSVPVIIAAKTILEKPGDKKKFIYQIHLLSRTLLELDQISTDIGLDPHIPIRGIYGWKTIREYHELSNGYADRLGALISDKTVTVSKEYIKELVKRLGWDLEKYFDYIPNATTWKLPEIINSVIRIHPGILREINIFKPNNRRSLRTYTELKALGNMPQDEPVITDREFREFLKRISLDPLMPDGKTKPFMAEGPLVIMTGRLARQKGVHVLLKSIEDVVFNVPNARILLLLLPVWGERRLARELVEAVSLYRENLRVIFGKAKSLFYLAHISSDVMVIPSLYEPFGLVALEGMLTGNMIVASRIGGLAETVKDIHTYGLDGTGLHVEPGDPVDLAAKLSDALLFMETGYYEPWSKEWYRLVERINDKTLRKLLYSNPKAPWIIRKSSHNRALKYTWEKSARKALMIYAG